MPNLIRCRSLGPIVAELGRLVVPVPRTGEISVMVPGRNMSCWKKWTQLYSSFADQLGRKATKFELVVNLKTASAIDMAISPALLLRADEVIE